MAMDDLFERNQKKTIFMIVICLLASLDLAAGVLFKAYTGRSFRDMLRGDLAARFKAAREHEKEYRRPSDIYHHDLAKKVLSEQASWGNAVYTVATDSLGFKTDKPKDTPMSSDAPRLLLIGDSFTEGIGFPFRESFAGLAAGALAENDGTELLNAAVSSYSPIIYYRKIKYLLDRGLKFDSVIVFLDLSDIQDEALFYEMDPDGRVLRRRPEPAPPEDDEGALSGFIKGHTVLTFFFFNKLKGLWLKRSQRHAVGQERALWTVDPELFDLFGKAGLEKCDLYMDELAGLLKTRHIPLSVAVYPWPDQIVRGDLDSIQVRHWREWAARHGAGFLDYFPCFIEPAPGKDPYDVLDRYFIPGDMHWNKEGHRLIAGELVSFFEGKKGRCARSAHSPRSGGASP